MRKAFTDHENAFIALCRECPPDMGKIRACFEAGIDINAYTLLLTFKRSS